MSVVTTVLLYTHVSDDDKIAVVNAALLEIEGGRFEDGTARYFLRNISDDQTGAVWGGTKWPVDLWGGAFNCFPLGELCRILLSIRDWKRPQAVSLMVEVDYDERGFRLFKLGDLDRLASDRSYSP